MRKWFDVVRPGGAILLALLICAAALPARALDHTENGPVVYGWDFTDEEGTGVRNVVVQTQAFAESDKELRNPDRGFYRVYRFEITDTGENYLETVRKYCSRAPKPTLALVEINLRHYRDGDISQAGLDNISGLLDAWAESGQRLILRFLYDWDGKNLDSEPENLDIVLRHIKQVGPILLDHAGAIYTLQGLFVGSYGEMHNTKFGSDKDLRRLAWTLVDVTGGSIYLSVRTPGQWQMITDQGTNKLAARMGLFNDGIMGNERDLGTYVTMTRDEGLDFQEKLCTKVPNGGEVVLDNEYNDFEKAVNDLATMHITYLNQYYDRAVLDKWASATVSGRDCFDGMDGLTYISRHLGYRLLISKMTTFKNFSPQGMRVSVDFRNVGFAPLYTSPELTLVLRDETGSEVLSYPMGHNLTALSGGHSASKTGSAQAVIPLGELTDGVYRLYVDLKDPASGMPILLANEQEREENGYFLGTATLSGGSCATVS